MTRRAPTGMCFKYAWERARDMVMDERELGFPSKARIVHGHTKKLKNHAWVVTPGGLVFDEDHPKGVSEDMWYLVNQPVEEAVYTPREAFQTANVVGNFGPWYPDEVVRSTKKPRRNPSEWDEEYGQPPYYARDFEKVRVPVSQIASPFINPIKQERVDELGELEDDGYTLPPVIVDGPSEVEEVDYPEEKYPFLDGHEPEVGEAVWYVHDGHHRVALAIQRGHKFIDALVLEG